MNFPDHLTSLIYLKSKLQKWKNIALFFAIFSILLTFKLIFGTGIKNDVIDSNYIANIKIEGAIFRNDYRSKILKEIAEQKNIRALIINIDSPGGEIVGSEILFNEIRKIAEKKPTVVVMNSVAASGAYMSAVASDYIIAHNGTLTGSIGVLMESPEITDLANKIGIKFNTYKSSPLKGSPSLFEKNNPKVEKIMQESIIDSYQFFVELVKNRRANKLNKNMLNEIFDGRVFTGRQALKVGLVDKIGNFQDALDYLLLQKIDFKQIPIRDVDVIEKENNFFDKLLGYLPFSNNKNSNFFDKKIMAVMPWFK